MTTPQTPSAEPKKKNCFLWGCLTVIILIILAACCLGSLVGLSLFTDLNPLGFYLENQINEFIDLNDFYDDTSGSNDLPKMFDSEGDSDQGDEDPTLEDTTSDSALDDGSSQLVVYPDLEFPFSFSYPVGWEIDAQEFSVSVSFYHPSNNNYLVVGRDWLCQGCLTAADSSVSFLEALEFQAELDNFNLIESAPFYVPAGDDAHFTACEWVDFDDNYHWAYSIHVVVEEDSMYLIMYGDTPENFDQYGELIKDIGASFVR